MEPDADTRTHIVPNHRDEIDRLLSLEFGNKADVTFRLIGVPLGSILIYLYTDHVFAFAWSAGYVICYIAYRVFLESLGPQVSRMTCGIAHCFIVVLTLSFLWMPAWMCIQFDRNLTLVGAALVGAQLVHLAHRGDTAHFLIVGLLATVGSTMLLLLVFVLPEVKDPIATIGILISWLALLLYFAQSMISARRRIIAKEAADLQAFQAQKLSAIGQLAGGIAHDFNNILTAISGNLELYEVLTDNTERDAVIAAAQDSSKRAAKIVSQILIYARKSPLELKLVDSNAPIASLDILIEHLVPSNIQLAVRPLPSLHFVRIDIDQLVTALMNLVVNAVDVVPRGGRVSLTVTLTETIGDTQVAGDRPLKQGTYIVYEVADTGTGIPPNIIESVIDPFFTTKPVGKGTGLGLSMVFAVADSFDGGLEIDSSQSGTAMRMYIPVARPPAERGSHIGALRR